MNGTIDVAVLLKNPVLRKLSVSCPPEFRAGKQRVLTRPVKTVYVEVGLVEDVRRVVALLYAVSVTGVPSALTTPGT